MKDVSEWDAALDQAYAARKQAYAALDQAYAAWKQADWDQAYAAWKRADAAWDQAYAAWKQAYAACHMNEKYSPATKGMTMNVTLSIDKKGHLPGTLGWLCENAATIHVGLVKGGKKSGAWLKDKDGNNITVLAIRGYWGIDTPGVDAHQIDKVNRGFDGISLNADRDFTDAAWKIIEQMAEIAQGLLEEPAELADEVAVTVA